MSGEILIIGGRAITSEEDGTGGMIEVKIEIMTIAQGEIARG